MTGGNMRQKCFECGGKAEELHHVVPRTVGGTKMIHLCSTCHGKVHGLFGRVGHVELTKRGLDKGVAEELAAVWWHHFVSELDIGEVAKITNLTQNVVKRRVKRVKEMDDKWREELFSPITGALKFYNFSLYGCD